MVGFSGGHALAMPFAALDGVRRGCRAVVTTAAGAIRPSERWLGRVVNARAEPIDGQGPLPPGPAPYPYRARRRRRTPGIGSANRWISGCVRSTPSSPSAAASAWVFSRARRGQIGAAVHAGPQVSADISVIGLVGERGREVQEFLQDDLGAAGLARSVVVVSTSDEPALMRRQAAYLTLAIAEYFRDLGKDVLVLMDSVTRFAMAQREIGLSAGEPPTAKGYTPTVFVELPRLLERAGPGDEKGTITGIFSVLVDGDDHNEPVADAVRGILDGHIVMERAIAERGRYPAINVLKSISRTMPRAADPAYLPAINRARQVMATYSDMEELIRLGAYRAGSSAEVDEAITLHKPLEAFLAQSKEEATSMAEGYQRLERILRGEETQN